MSRLISCMLAMLLAASGPFSGGALAAEGGQTRGQRAPQFTLPDLDGRSVELASLLGKGPVLLTFWATWCKPCLEELGELQKYIPSYQARGVTAVAISTDSEKSVAKVKPLARGKNYPFLVLLDTNAEVARRYYANPIPFTVIIDKAGSIVYKHLGYEKGDELEVQRTLDLLLQRP